MAQRDAWSRKQLIIAFKLYCEMPFGRMHSQNPEIIRFARLIGRTPSALAMKMTNIASLDPAITSTGRKGLRGASRSDRDMWDQMTSDWDRFSEEITQTQRELEGSSAELPETRESDDPISYVGATRTVQIEARVGQSFFRKAVLSAYSFKCCITGLDIPELLIASHIIPWRFNPENRLNPRNGLALSPLHDRAFDLGLFTISENHQIRISRRISSRKSHCYFDHAFHRYADKAISLPEKFAPDPSFLKFHRESIFQD